MDTTTPTKLVTIATIGCHLMLNLWLYYAYIFTKRETDLHLHLCVACGPIQEIAPFRYHLNDREESFLHLAICSRFSLSLLSARKSPRRVQLPFPFRNIRPFFATKRSMLNRSIGRSCFRLGNVSIFRRILLTLRRFIRFVFHSVTKSLIEKPQLCGDRDRQSYVGLLKMMMITNNVSFSRVQSRITFVTSRKKESTRSFTPSQISFTLRRRALLRLLLLFTRIILHKKVLNFSTNQFPKEKFHSIKCVWALFLALTTNLLYFAQQSIYYSLFYYRRLVEIT